MPIIPSFHAYAPQADLAQAYLGGQRIAQEAAADAARIQLGYATLRQRGIEAELESQARQKQIEAQTMRQMQENEFTKAYHDTQLGLAERRLQNEEAYNQVRMLRAAQDFSSLQQWQRRAAALRDQGKTPEEAARIATLESGGVGLSAAITSGKEPSQLPRMNLENRVLQQQKQDLLRPFTMAGVQLPIPPDVQAKLDEITQRQQSFLSPMTNAPQSNAPAVKRLRYNPKTGEFE